MLRLLLLAVVAGAYWAGRWDVLVLLVAAVVGVYAVSCWLWPFRKCWRCHGSGKRFNDSGSAFGVCRWCRGLKVERYGRRLWTYWRHGS